MNSSKAPTDPFSVVAKALGCPRESLSVESAINRDHGWDSFGHISIITALEKAHAIKISNDEVMSLTTMKAIVEFTKRLREGDNRKD